MKQAELQADQAPPAGRAKSGDGDTAANKRSRFRAPRNAREAGKMAYDFFASIRLTVVLLFLGVWLIFWATLAQVQVGIRGAQEAYFEGFLQWFYLVDLIGPERFANVPDPLKVLLHLPVPGGYLVGPLLVVNLLAAHFKYFKPSLRKIGIPFIHVGIIMLILSQFTTDLIQEESRMVIEEGGSTNYLERFHDYELAIEKIGDENNVVSAVPTTRLRGATANAPVRISDGALPFGLRVDLFYPNSRMLGPMQAQQMEDAPEPIKATRGFGKTEDIVFVPAKVDKSMEGQNIPTARVELLDEEGVGIGSFLVSMQFREQRFTHDGETYEISLRPQREYLPYRFELIELTHEVYPGTQTPKNFASRILIFNENTGEQGRVKDIFMNNPLRYEGKAFYQYQMEKAQNLTVFQVVRNPGWLVPYLACAIVSFGLLAQFGVGLWRFVDKRR